MTTLVAIAGVMEMPARLAAQASPLDPHTAQPERPTVSTNASTVAPHWIEIESGIERDRFPDRSHGDTTVVVAKLGVGRRLQLELQMPVVWTPNDDHGIGAVSTGVKWRLAEHARFLGDVALVPSITVPFGPAGQSHDATLIVVSSRELGPVALDLNLGYTHRGKSDGFAAHDIGLWTAAFSGQAGDRLGWAAEVFGHPGTAGPAGEAQTVAVLSGPTFKIRRWLVADTGVIVPVAGLQPRAVFAGLVYNVGHWGHR